MSSTNESSDIPRSKEEQEMLDKAQWFIDQIKRHKDTIDYYYIQIGKIEEATYKAQLAKKEMLYKINELNENIKTLEERREKEVNFLEINLKRGDVQ